MLCGNTVVFKPASDTPATATSLVEILLEAGVPEGVVNIVHGGGGEVGMAIVGHPDVDLVSFTGSTGGGQEDLGGRGPDAEAGFAGTRRKERADRDG